MGMGGLGGHGGMGQGPENFGQDSRMQGMEMLMQFRMMFRGLDLSEDQVEDIRSIVEDTREEVRAIMESAAEGEERTPFIEIFTQPNLTLADLRSGVDRLDEVREEARDLILQAVVDVHDVLTAEQLEELARMAEEHGMGREHGPMGHPGMR